MIAISNLNLTISEGGTIASTKIYGPKTYINTRSGNVFKLSWDAPIVSDESINSYRVVLRRYDSVINTYYDVFNKNVGKVTEFYVESSILTNIALPQYQLSIYVVAQGQNNTYTSDIKNTFVSNGGGNYVKVSDGYTQPIMKRALAFANAGAQTSKSEFSLMDSNGKALVDANGETLTAKATKLLEIPESGWAVVQKSYVKDASGSWRANDIKYEILVDVNGNIIYLDSNGTPNIIAGDPVYVL